MAIFKQTALEIPMVRLREYVRLTSKEMPTRYIVGGSWVQLSPKGDGVVPLPDGATSKLSV